MNSISLFIYFADVLEGLGIVSILITFIATFVIIGLMK